MNCIILVTIISTLTSLVTGSCFFPTELQGSYAVQYTEGDPNDIWYRSVSISYDLISGIGECVFRQSERYVLKSEAGCYKCAWLRQRSSNVLTLSQSQQCHNTADSAWQYCTNMRVPTTSSMLYRAGNKVRPSHCPITGRFSVQCYGGSVEAGARGEADTCPDESLLSLTCPGGEEQSYQCLGDWEGEDGRRYLSLLDRVLPQVGEAARPRWRCATYQEDGDRVLLTMSNDSTCDNLSQHYSLTKQVVGAQVNLETEVTLPDWAQGSWDSVTVTGGHLVYRSSSLLTTHRLTALQSHSPQLYTVRVHTDCGQTGYSCLQVEGRGQQGRILQLSLGQIFSDRGAVQCAQLTAGLKVTQLRHKTECPMTGEWQGEIPDGEGLCARSVTHCDRPHQMKYQVYNCAAPSEVYEDRLYECYGQYSQAGQVYTLTKRLDLQERQECFVGVTGQDGKHKIMEAGQHCDPGMQPERYGMVMEMVREQRCDDQEEYQENVSEIEMRLLHPKLSLNTGVMIDTNSLDSSVPPGSEPFNSGCEHVRTSLAVIFPSLIVLLRSLSL